MKLSLIFELLLIFVLLAFAASRVIGKNYKRDEEEYCLFVKNNILIGGFRIKGHK